MKYKLYVLRDPYNGNVRYVGITRKGIEIRFDRHLSEAKFSKENWPRYTWIRSLLKRNAKPIIQELEQSNSLSHIKLREIWWVNYFVKRGIDLKNATKGGDYLSENAMIKAQEANQKQKRKIKQYSEEGILIKIHDCISDAAFEITGDRKQNGKLVRCAKGRARMAFGFIWRYEEDDFNTHRTIKNPPLSEEFKNRLSVLKTGTGNPQYGKIGLQNLQSKQYYACIDCDCTYFESVKTLIKFLKVTPYTYYKLFKQHQLINGYRIAEEKCQQKI